MRGLDIDSFIRMYIAAGEDPMKDYETVREAIKLEESTKAAIAACMEQMNARKKEKKGVNKTREQNPKIR